MESHLVLWVVGALAGLVLAPRIKQRLELSLAKHPSLRGHSRMASFLARLVPFYEYDDLQFFRVDSAPDAIEQRRREAFFRLSRDYRSSRSKTMAWTEEVEGSVSDLQFTASYRVPFQFSRNVRRHLGAGAVIAASSGGLLRDLDGNESFDLTGSYGVNVFGHEFYKECMEQGENRARDLGPVLGSYHPTVAENVRRLKEISGLDEVSFHMSGTEAVMQAVRLARYHTGRSHLVSFCGAYHGWWDDVQPGVGNPVRPSATYTLKEMDESTLRVLRTRSDIACVLVNPLQALHPNCGAPSDSALLSSNRTAGFDRADYTLWLERLRRVCTERGIALILDEVFVGFRLAPGGAQEYFGVRADLVTYGKTLAGGLPVGAVCGRSEWMRRFREDRPADICFARGTFNSHPYVMTAMNEFLARLDTREIAGLYLNLETTWTERALRLNARLAELNLPVRVANLSTIWTVLYTRPSCYNWMFQYYLRAHGLALAWVGTGRLIFSLTTTEADFAAVANRFEAAALEMEQDGWWWADDGLTNGKIHRRLFREMVAARFSRRTAKPSTPLPPPVAEASQP